MSVIGPRPLLVEYLPYYTIIVFAVGYLEVHVRKSEIPLRY